MNETTLNAVSEERETIIELIIDRTDHWRGTQSSETVACLEEIIEAIRQRSKDCGNILNDV